MIVPSWTALAAAVVIVLALLALISWLLIRPRDDGTRTLVKRAGRLPLKSKFRLAARLARDRRIPVLARLIPPALVLYLATPLDIIPDFIPVLGHLDDVLVVMLAAALLVKLVPRWVLEEEIARLEPAKGEALV